MEDASRTNRKTEAWLQTVRNCVLLARLPPAELNYVLSSAKPIRTVEGEHIFEQGDTIMGGYVYLVASGLYRALVFNDSAGGDERESFKRETLSRATSTESSFGKGRRMRQHRAREYGPQTNFGGSELLVHDSHGERTCTVTVLRSGLLWGIPQRVCDGKLRIPPPLSVPGCLSFLPKVKLFAELSKPRLEQLARGAVQMKLAAGERVCALGDPAHAIFVCLTGSVITSNPNNQVSITIEPPTSFGEAALAADEELRVRGSSITAGPDGATLLTWEVSAIETLVGFVLQSASNGLHNKHLIETTVCGSRSVATGLTKEQLDDLIDLMVERPFERKQVALAQGEKDDALYFIKSGEAAVVVKSRGEVTRLVTTLKRGDCFGELALLPDGDAKRTKRKASVCAAGSHPLITLALTAEALGEMPEVADWWRDLAAHIAAKAMAGWDTSVVERLRASDELHLLTEDDAKGKGGSRLLDGRDASKRKKSAKPPAGAGGDDPAGKSGGGKGGGLRRKSVTELAKAAVKAGEGVKRRMSITRLLTGGSKKEQSAVKV